MNKRKTTSIALAAAVAISTVQLAYPANVFAHPTVQNEESKIEDTTNVSGENTPSEEVMESTSNEDWSKCDQCSKEKPHIISTVDDLDKIRTHIKEVDGQKVIDGYFKLANNITFTEADFAEGGKFYNKGWGWTPIGHNNKSSYFSGDKFVGELDGNNCTVSGIKINRPGGYWYNGLIAAPSGNSYIHDLILDKFDLHADHTGALCGQTYSKNVIIENIKVKNSKFEGIYGTAKYSGMLVGGTDAKISNIVIDSCDYVGNSAWKGSYIAAEMTGGILENVVVKKCNLKTYAYSGMLLATIGGDPIIRNINIIESDFITTHDAWSYLAFDDYRPNSTDKTPTISDINIDLNVKGKSLSKNGHVTVPNVKVNENKPIDINNANINLSYEDGSKVSLINQKNVVYFEENRPTEASGYAKVNNQQIGAYLNGGTLPENIQFEYDKLVLPVKEGYAFLGWYEDKDFSGEPIKNPEVGKTYYARWIDTNEYGKIEYGNVANISIEDNEGKIIGNYKSSDESVIKVDKNGKLTPTGVGEAIISYSVNYKGKEILAMSRVIVKAPDGTVAMIDKVPYTDLQKAIDSETSENEAIKVVGDIELKKPLDLSGKKSRTIYFSSDKYTVKPSKDYSYETLIKIEGKDSYGIVIKNAKFDTSSKDGLNAIKVVGKEGNKPSIVVENIEVNNTGNNKGSAIYVENASLEIKGDASVPKESPNRTVVEIQGDGSEVVLDKNATVNNELKPEIGNNHSDDIIIGNKTESNDFVNGNNATNGGGSVTPSIPSTPSKPSKPVYTHTEISGADRYETAAKVADELGSYNNVVLVNATSTMSDGLSASGLAGKENGAILLTKKDSIPKVTMDRIRKVKRVYIIGGEAAISQKVAAQITAAGVKVERIGGKDRVETSKLVAEKLGNYSDAFIVNGFKGEADAMSASSVAARYGAPILLTNGKTSTHAKKSGVEYYVVGGSSVVNKSIAKKYDAEVLAGKDRYATNREVIDEFYSGSDKLYLANGDTLVDALTASTIAKNHGIVLVNKKSDNSVLKDKNTVQIGGMNFDIDFE